MTTVRIMPQSLKKNLAQLLAAARRGANGAVGQNKDEFHRAGKSVLRAVLKDLGVDGDIRSCSGGPAVLGEVILHADDVYVCLCASAFGPRVPEFYYRSCKGRKDYTGGPNQRYSFEKLAADPTAFVTALRSLLKTPF